MHTSWKKRALVTLYLQGKEAILDVAAQIAQTERQFGIDTSVEDYQKELKFGLVEVVYEWAREMVRMYRYICRYVESKCAQYPC